MSLTPIFYAAFGAFIGPFFTRLVDHLYERWRGAEMQQTKQLDDFLQSVTQLLDDCEEFWGHDAEALGPRNVVLRARIPAELDSLKTQLQRLFDGTNWSLKNSKDEWSAIYRAATGGKFDDSERKADAGILTIILQAGWQLRSNCEHRRSKPT